MALMPRCSSDPADKPTPKIVDGLTSSIELPASHHILMDRPGRSFELPGTSKRAKRSAPELKRAFAEHLAGKTVRARILADILADLHRS